MNNKLFDELDLETKISQGILDQGRKLYQVGSVNKIDVEKKTIQGRVADSDKVYYPEIIVKHDRLATNCTCHFDDGPICPHCAALGFAYIYGIKATNTKENTSKNSDYVEKFLYHIKDIFSSEKKEVELSPGFMLDINKENQTFSIFFYNKKDKSIIAQPDKVYHQILGNPHLTKTENALIKFLVDKHYWDYFSPLNYSQISNNLSEILTLFDEVEFVNPKSLKTISIQSNPLKLKFDIKFKEPNLNIDTYFTHSNRDIALSDTTYIDGLKNYISWDHYIFPVHNDIYKEFLPLLIRNNRLDLSGDTIAIFMGEILPSFPKGYFEINIDNSVNVIKIINITPEIELQLKEKNKELTIQTVYHYGENAAKDTEISATKYHYLYKNEKHLYLKKDPYSQLDTENLLENCGFIKNENQFIADQHDGLEFICSTVPSLPENYTITGIENLSFFRIDKTPIKVICNTNKKDKNIEINLEFKHGKQTLENELIISQIKKKNNFIKLGNNNFSRIPIEKISAFKEQLKNMSGNELKMGVATIPDYFANIILENFRDHIECDKQTASFMNNLSSIENLKNEKPPKELNATLREYQLEGYNWLRFLQSNSWGGILADDMGLGKTLQSLALIQKTYETKNPPTLIILPTSVLFNWEREINKFTNKISTIKYYGTNRQKLLNKLIDHNIVLTTYGIARKDIDLLKEINFNFIIIDEAQNIKNPASQTTKAIKKLKAKSKIALTGTPLENNLTELWSIFDFIMPGFLGTQDSFERNFELFIESDEKQKVINELKTKIYPFILRRTKEEVVSELPPKIEDNMFCQMNDNFDDSYTKLKNNLRKDILNKIQKDGLSKHRMSIFTAMLKLRQLCCHPSLVKDPPIDLPESSAKFETFKNMINQIIEEDHKVLVFSQFTGMLSIIKKWLEQNNISYSYLDGTTKNREKAVDQFNNNAEIKIFLISLKAGGTGLNLTSADYVIHYDPWWNPAVQAQATDRAYRIGQKRKVFSYKFITKDTIEERIMSLQEKKQDLFDNILSEGNKGLSKLTDKDIEFLLN